MSGLQEPELCTLLLPGSTAAARPRRIKLTSVCQERSKQTHGTSSAYLKVSFCHPSNSETLVQSTPMHKILSVKTGCLGSPTIPVSRIPPLGNVNRNNYTTFEIFIFILWV